MKTLKALILVVTIFLNGCAMVADPVSITSNVISGSVWAGTGKSTGDHVLSFITGKDCVTLRIFSRIKNEYICEEYTSNEEVVYEVRGLDKVML